MDWLKESYKYKEDFLSTLKELVAIPSLEDLDGAYENAPFGKEVRRALDYMLDLAKKDGFEVIDYDGYAGVIMYGEGEETVGVLGHMDIVPIGEGWTHDPLGCEIQDGYVFGRGVSDDKGPTLAAYYSLKMMKDLGIVPNKKILLIVGCNEETGMKCMDYYKEHGIIPDCGFSPDAMFPVVYGEKGHVNVVLQGNGSSKIIEMHAGERPNIVIGKATCKIEKLSDEEKALFAYYLKTNALTGSITECDDYDTLEIQGKYYHAAECYNGINAALHMMNFVGCTFDDALCNDFYALLKDWKGTDMDIYCEGADMGFLTVNTGIVNIDENGFNITLDIRYPNEMKGDKIIANIKHALASKSSDITVASAHDSKPLFVDPRSHLIQTLENSYRTYSNDYETPLRTMGGGTYARKFDNFVAFGAQFPDYDKAPFFVGGPHEKDEGIKIEDLMKSMAIYADAIQVLGE